MDKYAHVTDGVIDYGPGPLPASWRNISGLDKSSPEELAKLGWLPVETTMPPSFNDRTEELNEPIYQVLSTKVREIYSKRVLSNSEARERIPPAEHPALGNGTGEVTRLEMNALKAYLRGNYLKHAGK